MDAPLIDTSCQDPQSTQSPKQVPNKATFDEIHLANKVGKEDISELVTCPLCVQYYQKPKRLPCGHSVCRDCLHVYVEESADQGSSFLCPICRRNTTLPKGGVDGFTQAFFIVRLQDEYNKVPTNRSCDPCSDENLKSVATTKCIDCCEYLCADCTKAHSKARFSKHHHFIILGRESSAEEKERIRQITRIKCHTHQDEVVRYFCVPCQKLICRDCKALDHARHKATAFQDAVKGKRDVMRNELKSLQKKVLEVTAVADHFRRTVANSEEEKNTLIDAITGERDKLIMLITQLSAKAISRAESIKSNEMREQRTELEKAEFLLSQMQSQIQYTDILLSDGSDVEIIDARKLIKERTSRLNKEHISVPRHHARDLQLSPDSSITDRLENHFKLSCTMASCRDYAFCGRWIYNRKV